MKIYGSEGLLKFNCITEDLNLKKKTHTLYLVIFNAFKPAVFVKNVPREPAISVFV